MIDRFLVWVQVRGLAMYYWGKGKAEKRRLAKLTRGARALEREE